MCEWGDIIHVRLSHPRGGKIPVGLDRCIASLVIALNEGGEYTKASCCGHGKMPFGNIALRDGRELLIFPNWGAARFAEMVLSVAWKRQISEDKP